MRILVCGGRDYCDRSSVFDALSRYTPSVIIEGGARGADRFGREWAQDNNVPVETYPADWETHRKAAGPIRNAKMLKEGKPDLVVAFRGGKGTLNMMTLARRAGVRVEMYDAVD
jgi:hypothetical protein